MKKRSVKKTKKLVMKYMRYWAAAMGLNWYSWGVGFDIDWVNFNHKKDKQTGMRVFADWRYMRFDIEVNVPVVRDLPDKEIERLVIHELVHVFLNELNADVDHEERAVTMLTNAFGFVRDQIRRDCKEAK